MTCIFSTAEWGLRLSTRKKNNKPRVDYEPHSAMTVHYYFEAGHRKAPCDGVGGMAKRMADEAVKTGKVKIQYAVDLYDWARKN